MKIAAAIGFFLIFEIICMERPLQQGLDLYKKIYLDSRENRWRQLIVISNDGKEYKGLSSFLLQHSQVCRELFDDYVTRLEMTPQLQVPFSSEHINDLLEFYRDSSSNKVYEQNSSTLKNFFKLFHTIDFFELPLPLDLIRHCSLIIKEQLNNKKFLHDPLAWKSVCALSKINPNQASIVKDYVEEEYFFDLMTLEKCVSLDKPPVLGLWRLRKDKFALSFAESLQLWNVTENHYLESLKINQKNDVVFKVLELSNGNILIGICKPILTHGNDSNIMDWDWHNKKKELLKTGYGNNVHEGNDFCELPDNKIAVTANNNIKIIMVPSDELLITLIGHTDQVHVVQWLKKENILMSGAEDNTIKVWDITSAQCLKTFYNQPSMLQSICDLGNNAVSVVFDNYIKIMNLSDLSESVAWQFPHDFKTFVTFQESYEEKKFGTVRLWEIMSNPLSHPCKTFCFTDNQKLIVVPDKSDYFEIKSLNRAMSLPQCLITLMFNKKHLFMENINKYPHIQKTMEKLQLKELGKNLGIKVINDYQLT